MNKQHKIGITIAYIIALAISLVGFAYLQEITNNQNPNQQTPPPDQNEKPNNDVGIINVRIIKFEWTSYWVKGPVPGDVRFRHFNTTIQNSGNMEVNGLIVEVKIIANNSELQTWTHILYGTLDGLLHGGESRELIGRVTIGLDVLEQASGERTDKILVILDDSVLDELTLP
jgi:hypothetical protein